MGIQKINYQKELDRQIEKLQREGSVPRLLLHSCCAPCSSYVLEYLSKYFEITVYYYNPNIYPEAEYTKRIIEQQSLITQMHFRHPVCFLAGPYEKEKFYERVRGMEQLREGGQRCFECFALRLAETAKAAVRGGYDYFTTTLTISPHKNAQKLNEIGTEIGDRYGIRYLKSDFKKKNGYKRSIELSEEYGLYRQDYCGCEYSYAERERQKKAE